jgi:acyl-coenzyme A synthetase/AMP-(fatty) acid ligase
LEIENVIMDTGLVIETVVLGVKDDMLRKKLIAMVVGGQDGSDRRPTEQMVLKMCAEKLPKFKWPSEVRLERMLPKGGNGKIDRRKCLELLDRK